jgi:hypothetical protein
MEAFFQIVRLVCCGLGFLCCLGIAISDFRSREVHVLFFVGFGIAGLMHGIFTHPIWALRYTLGNLLLCGMILGVIWIWSKIFRRSRRGLFLGAGDIVMMACLGAWLHPVTYIGFFVGSIWFILLATLAYRKLRKLKADWPVPLAGAQAALFLPLLVVAIVLDLQGIKGDALFLTLHIPDASLH